LCVYLRLGIGLISCFYLYNDFEIENTKRKLTVLGFHIVFNIQSGLVKHEAYLFGVIREAVYGLM
jgi:hypothetical protein